MTENSTEALALTLGAASTSVADIDSTPLLGPKLLVAVSANSSNMIDAHFGSCSQILVFEVNKTNWQLLEIRPVNSLDSSLKRIDYLVSLIGDCQLLATLSIGGPAAAKVTRAGIHPLKRTLPSPVEPFLVQIQQVVSGTPPPWIRKLLEQQEVSLNEAQ